ncbi:MAG: thioredoxin domain-containing protein [Parasphingorhabdus sp.]
MSKSLYFSSVTMAFALALTGCSGEAETENGATSGETVETVSAPEGQNWSTTVTQTEEGGYVMGNPDAPIKLVEYMSITCSHCATFGEEAFNSIRDDYVESGRVSFEIRNFVRDPLDLTAAMLSRCGGEGPFFALTKQALNNQEQMFTKAQGMGEATYNSILQSEPKVRFVKLAEELGLIGLFQQLGISEDQAKTCLSEEATAEKLMSSTQTAVEQYDIQGTPTFLINGKRIEGTNWAMVEAALKEAGAR